MDVHEPYIAENDILSKINPQIKLSKNDMFSLFKDSVRPRDISDLKKVDILKKAIHGKGTGNRRVFKGTI